MMRLGHETRVDLYSKAKAAATPMSPNDRMAAFNTRKSANNKAFLGSSDKTMGKMMGAPVDRATELQSTSRALHRSGIIERGHPASDPRLDSSSPHYLKNYADRLDVSGWHKG